MKNRIKYIGDPKFDKALRSLDSHMFIAGKAVSTRARYNYALRSFIQKINKLPEECDKNEIVNAIVLLQVEKGFQSSTLKHYIYTIKYYLEQIADRKDLFSKIPIPVTKMYDVEILTISEVKRLFASCKNSRDLMIIQLLYETGIRIQELLNLKFHDIDLYNNSLMIVNSKNKITRTVFFGHNLAVRINNYMEANKSIFEHIQNNKHNPQKLIELGKGGVRHMMKTTTLRSGISKRITPHLLRHAFSVHYLNFGGTIHQLQKLLGHRSLKTTICYLQYAILPEAQNISILDKLLALEIKTKSLRA